MDMPNRRNLMILHAVDGLLTGALAGVFAWLFQKPLIKALQPFTDQLSSIGVFWILVLVFFLCATAMVPFRRQLRPVVRSVLAFPRYFHFGLIPKVLVAFVVYRALPSLTSSQDNLTACLGIVAAILGLATSYAVDSLVRSVPGIESVPAPSPAKSLQPEDWVFADRPIERLDENEFPEHLFVVKRAAERLCLLATELSPYKLPSLALVGDYGSGKTSICNMVKDSFEGEKLHGRDVPNIVFRRYEAWQFITPEATVRGLIQTISDAILEEIDAPLFWRLPERYVSAIKETGTGWLKALATLMAHSADPSAVLGEVGDTLLRLGLRLVIFIDDLDRVERHSLECQQALTEALNLLQGLPNIQYVICIGPTSRIPSGDLLKLTRFQEQMPRLEPQNVLDKIMKSRDKASGGTGYYPWAELSPGERDPLKWNRLEGGLGLTTYRIMLVELIGTPRALKTVLRETEVAWQRGLDGELNWYDLLVANALRFAEPAVFEWILRDPQTFIGHPTKLEQKKAEGNRDLITKMLKDCLGPEREERYEIVLKALTELFPAFAERVDPNAIGGESPSPSQQRISYRDYIGRYFSGGLVENEVPDQPTLRYIRLLRQEGFSKKAFEDQYLSSLERLTGSMNKVVQFAGLIPMEHVFSICDTILAWISDPQKAEVWPNPESFVSDMMGDVHGILTTAAQDAEDLDEKVNRLERLEERGRAVEKWITEKITEYSRKSPFVAIELVSRTHNSFGTSPSDLEEQLARELCDAFVSGKKAFLPAVRGSRFHLARLLYAMRNAPNYADIKLELTGKLISEANADDSKELRSQFVLSLVGVRYPARSGEIPLEAYEISVDKKNNDDLYDMNFVVPALRKWQKEGLPDKLAEKAMENLLNRYETA